MDFICDFLLSQMIITPLPMLSFWRGRKEEQVTVGNYKYSVMGKPSSLIFINIYAIMKFQLNLKKKVKKKKEISVKIKLAQNEKVSSDN